MGRVCDSCDREGGLGKPIDDYDIQECACGKLYCYDCVEGFEQENWGSNRKCPNCNRFKLHVV